MNDIWRRRNGWLLVALLLLGFGLRLFHLETQSIWWDEGISLHLATSSWQEIVANRVVNIHPPLYFFLLKVWVTAVGESPFAARYLSLLASWLQIALVVRVCRSWFRAPTTWVAALLITLSPLSVVYAQEVRVYAFLPLVYLAVLYLTRLLLRDGGKGRTAVYAALGVVSWIGLHLHYITAFALAYAGLWAVFGFIRLQRWSALRRWIVTHLAVGLASLPWFVMVLFNWGRIQAEANAGTFVTEPVTLTFLVSQVWAFHLTGLAGALGQPLLALGVGVTAVLAVVTLFWRAARTDQRSLTLGWLLLWLLPLSSALVVWSVRSFSHPRYIAIFAIGLIPLLAYLIWPGRERVWQQIPGVLLGISVLVVGMMGLSSYFFDPATQKDDMRGVARYLESVASPTDLIIIPETDWSLLFEYVGETPIFMPEVSLGERVWPALAETTAVLPRVFLVDYPRGTRDWQGVLPFGLEMAGRLVQITPFDGLVVREYELERPLTAPTPALKIVNFGPLQLRGVWLQQGAAADTAVTAALRWQILEPTPSRFHLSLRLSGEGVPWETVDFVLVDGNGRPTDFWEPGEIVTTYQVLPLRPGTAPVDHELTAVVYTIQPDGTPRPVAATTVADPVPLMEANLGVVHLSPPQQNQSAYGLTTGIPPLAAPISVGSGLNLLGFVTDRGDYLPGQPVFVTLLWQAAADPMPDIRPVLHIEQNGNVLVADPRAPVNGILPTERWLPGQLVTELRTLIIPAGAKGEAQIVVALDDERFELGRIQINDSGASFVPPVAETAVSANFGDVARLVGVDVPVKSVNLGEPVPVTLYWEARQTGTAVAYTVFTQLIDANGVLIAQHDAPPVSGSRPTTGWLAGEYVTDFHQMTFRDGVDYRGSATIVVGLYDPATGARLLTDAGTDYFTLPVTIEIR